jgi:hypothetical protein
MFFSLAGMGTNMLLAGRSNVRLAEPCQNTAFTLVRITSALVGRAKDLDRVIEIKAIITIRDAIPEVLYRADNKLRRDEAKAQRERKRKMARRRR